MKRKTLFTDMRFEVQADDAGGPGRFAGYAVTYGQTLISGDIVRKGAFDASAESFLQRGALLSQHEWDKVAVGYFDVARSDDHGFWIEGPWHSTDGAQASRTVAMERVAAGKSVPLSVGFLLDESEPVDSKDHWGPCIVTMGTLLEVSLVGVGNDPNATLTRVQGLRDDQTTFAGHSERTLAVLGEFVERARSLREMRGSEGRGLSEANVQRLIELADNAEQYAVTVRALCAPVVPVSASMVPAMMEIERVLASLGGVR